ncbi:MAG: glycoside hydrolase family 71/99-like protein [Verrucomicrobiota bacterium]
MKRFAANFGSRSKFFLAKNSLGFVVALAGWLASENLPAQTIVKISALTPGTEWTTVVSNGDFESQGPLAGSRHPNPAGWAGSGEMSADPGTNTTQANGNAVAKGYVNGGAPVGLLQRTVTLEPATDYVLSAYLWNFGDAANHVNVVVDFNDAPGEPQLILYYNQPGADQGCFVYRYFNSATTGTNLTLRIFYDGLIGTGTAAQYFPLAAQWDNVAISRASYFALAQTNSRVALNLAKNGDAVQLAWPATPVQLAPLWTSNLAPPVAWTRLTNVAAVSNFQNVVAISNLAGNRFFDLADAVDTSTLDRKMLLGYQGWFACPGDGSPPNRWVHWFRSQTPTATNATFDFWPDISELDPDELFDTGMTLSNGTPARVYAAAKAKTVLRHFKWMREARIDGVFLQRFSSELGDPTFAAWRNQVTSNVWAGAESYGRVFAIMYDISGQPGSSLVSRLTNDWSYLVNTMKVTSSPRYQRHRGKPVVAIWGFGFTDRPGTPQDALTVINYFKTAGFTVMGGVPTYWRTLNNDSQTNSAWATVYRAYDIISPWAVGRYGNNFQADSFKQNLIVPDLAATKSLGLDYMPVIFPGFSWHNLFSASPPNQIPRIAGNFYWRQAYNATSAGCTMIFGAMFDEVDEGTAMFKLAPTAAELPAQGTFVPLNIDGANLPSDWYLRLAGAATRMLRGDSPVTSIRPTNP